MTATIHDPLTFNIAQRDWAEDRAARHAEDSPRRGEWESLATWHDVQVDAIKADRARVAG